MDNPKTIADVEALAAKVGITFSAEDYAQAHDLAEQRRQQVEHDLDLAEKSRTKTAAWVDQFNRWFPRVLKALHGLADVLITATHTILIAFGAPILLLLCMVVEHQRVSHGIVLFDASPAAAWLGAFVVVLGNLLLELLISWREHQTGWQEPPHYDFSLRLLARRLRYMFGQSVDWQPAAKSPAHRFKALLRVITITILVLALAGSMRSVLDQSVGNWYAAIGDILAHSTLTQIVTWFGGLLFALAVVRLAQVLSHFTAERVVEIVAVLQSVGVDRDVRALEAAGLTSAAALYARLKERQRQRRSGVAMASAFDMPEVGLSGSIRVPTVPETAGTAPLAENAVAVPTVPETAGTLSPAVRKAIKWLESNNMGEGLSVRQMAAVAGVSSSTMQRGITALKD